jgi:hypothetical protein
MRQIQRTPTELAVDDKGKEISTRLGQYNDAVTAQLAQKHAGKVVTIGQITKVQYGRRGSREQYVRSRLTKAVNMLLKAGIPAFPVYDDKGHHKKIGIKVVAEYNAEDYASLNEYQESAVARGEISRAKADLITAAMEALKRV